MIKIILYLIILFNISCVSNYYTAILTDDTVLYKNIETKEEIITVPKNVKVFLSRNYYKDKYRKIRFGNYYGLAYEPKYSLYSSLEANTSTKTTNYYNKYNTSTSGTGTIYVRGYYRKDGTYVRPHSRSSRKK